MAEPLSNPAVARPWLAIVGIGEDGRAGLTPPAFQALEKAELVVGGARHLALAQPILVRTLTWPSPLSNAYPEILAQRGRPVCVLATGDPFHYGVGAELARLVAPGEFVSYPQPSAFSLAAARLGWSLPDCACISVHGRALKRMLPLLQPGGKILALSWDGTTPARIASLLAEHGFGGSGLIVLERMGGPRERIRSSLAEDFDLGDIDPLNTVAIEVAAGVSTQLISLAPGLDDSWFENDGQLTKAEIRALTLAALAPRRGERLWDVGAGAGSVAIEWMLRSPANRATAVEARPDRADRIARNARHLGVPDLQVAVGTAPEALASLPEPDAIFIGGGASDRRVFETCWAALPHGGRLVVNAVTIETEAVLAGLFGAHGGSLKRIGISRAAPVGGMQGWRPAMPVTQWAVTKP